MTNVRGGGARPGARAGRRKGRPEAPQAKAVEVLAQGMALSSTKPPSDKGRATDRRPLGMDQRHASRRGPDNEVLAYCRRREAVEAGGQGGSRPSSGRGLQGKVAQEGRLHPMPQGIDCQERRRPGFRGRRVLQVQNARSFGAWLGLTPLRALQRRKREARRHHQGRQQAPATGARRVGLALPERVGALQRPRQRADPGPCGKKARGQGRPKAREEARGDAGARRPQEQGQCRHGQRTRGLGLGRRLHSRERLGHRNGELNQHRGTHIPSCGQIRGRWGEPQALFLRAPKAPSATEDCRIDRGNPSRSNGLPSAEMRHGRILNCKDERRKDTPRSPQEG